MPVVELPPGYDIREFRPGDVDAFPGHREHLQALGHDPDAYNALLADGGCFTVLKHGVPVGCAGILFADGAKETAWFLPGEDVKRHPKLHLKIARQFLAVAEQEYDLPAIYATAEAHNLAAQNWLDHLGFKREDAVLLYGQPHIEFVRRRG